VTDSDPYLKIGDYGLIGDCHTAALVSRTGSIDWCCLPRFDSGSAFGRLLDHERGGHCSITPTGNGPWEYERRYIEDTLVLETTLRGPAGEALIRDAFILADDLTRPTRQRQILRVIEGKRGSVELELRVAPRFDYGSVRPWIRRHGHRLHSAIGGNDALLVWCEQEFDEDPDHELLSTVEVGVGDRVQLSLRYCPPELIDADGGPSEPDPEQLESDLQNTIEWWRQWARTLKLNSRDEQPTRRSGMVLKALTYEPTGAVVAAPTTSLPEAIGGERNWDYRYAWVRDSSFSSRAFTELGCNAEADAFRAAR
jgi:GH15 family glucan-1,4-alpha-glucosidase